MTMVGINHIDFHKGQVDSVKINAIFCKNRCDFCCHHRGVARILEKGVQNVK